MPTILNTIRLLNLLYVKQLDDRQGSNELESGGTESPLRLQLVGHGVRCKDLVPRQTAHAAGTTADGTGCRVRDTTAVASDATSVAHSVRVLELLRRQEVQAGEC